MKFNLLDKLQYESKIESSVFEDLELKILFERFYEGSYYDLFEIMEHLPKIEETEKRSVIFTDILNDKKELFRTFNRLLEETIDSYRIYEASSYLLKECFSFVCFYKKFLLFIEKGKEILEELKPTSPVLINLRNYLKENYESATYKTLKSDCEEALKAIEKISSFVLSFSKGDNYMEALKVNGGYSLDEKLLSIALKMNIESENKLIINNKHDLDASLYNRLQFVYPLEYDILSKFYKKYKDITNFDFYELHDDLSFYLKMKTLFVTLNEAGIPYSKAFITNDGSISFNSVYDITLFGNVGKIIDNDCAFDSNHLIQIITGANGGGKTSYLRSIGVNYLLFTTLGYTFSKSASLKAIKKIYTHFPNDENYKVGYGRLKDELDRLSRITNILDNDSLFLSNETFSSTSEDIAFSYSFNLINNLLEKKVTTIFITHQQKLLDNINKEKIVLLNPVIDEESGNKRLFKIKKVDSEIHSFASDILKKYGLTKDKIKKDGE